MPQTIITITTPPRQNAGDRIADWKEEMVSRLLRSYQGWIDAGYTKEDAIAETLSRSTAGQASRDEFLRRVNPARCGVLVSGYPCTRKPGHRGPHLPQGATLRPRTRMPRWNQSSVLDRVINRLIAQRAVSPGDWRTIRDQGFANEDAGHRWALNERGYAIFLERLRASAAAHRGNPSAAALRETFVGHAPDHETLAEEPHMPAGDYAQLGTLLALYVKPAAGSQVQQISFSHDRPKLVADESQRLWFVGGDQNITASLGTFRAENRGAGLFELGEARRIDYKQRKEHLAGDGDEWRHDFGEETGVRPSLWFDSNNKRLLLKGGEYEIRPEGIVN